jgi:hypothetical protein
MKLPIVLVAVLLVVAGQAGAVSKDVEALLDGVGQIAAPGVPGPLCVFGDQAAPVVAGAEGGAVRQAVVAAARMGSGRVVAFGHPGYLDRGALAKDDTGRLMVNAVRWAAGSAGAPGNARVAVHKQPALVEFLREQGIKAEPLEGAGWAEKLGAFGVLCLSPASLATDADIAAVSRFVTEGGGLIAGDLGWGWLQLNPGKTLLADHQGNRLLAPAGIVWADGTLTTTAGSGYTAKVAPPELCHAGRALDALAAQAAGKAPLTPEDAAEATAVLTRAARSLPAGDKLLAPRLRRLGDESKAGAVPTARRPLTMKDPLARLLLTLQLEEINRLTPEQVKAHPAATEFPGAVPADAPRVTQTIEVDTAVPGWHSTGLYAAPGEAITVEAPEGAASRKLAVRIGAHTDSLWGLDSWQRAPEVCRALPLAKPVTRAASAFGGLVYVEAPDRGATGVVSVKIGGAVAAPYYVLGKTDLAEWRSKTRLRAAPWAELATAKVILTLPSRAVRGLEDPEGLMKFWDAVLDCCAELAAMPLDRRRPERYVTDVQISAGYMHSGYPIMTLLDMPEVMVDKARMTSNGHGGVWGLWHEMGHNHQSSVWTFDGTGEVTENLFTLYVFDKACGHPQSAFDRVTGQRVGKRRTAYVAGGAKFEEWKKDPFLGLQMYVQLQEAFGWDAYKKVFAEYRALARTERPKTDDEKRDQWMVRFSRAVGKNLGPFFQAWGVPTSEKARASIADLAPWMPEDFPPRQP